MTWISNIESRSVPHRRYLMKLNALVRCCLWVRDKMRKIFTSVQSFPLHPLRPVKYISGPSFGDLPAPIDLAQKLQLSFHVNSEL